MKTPVPVGRAGVSKKEGLRSEKANLHIPERLTPVAKLVLPRVRVPLPALQRLGLRKA